MLNAKSPLLLLLTAALALAACDKKETVNEAPTAEAPAADTAAPTIEADKPAEQGAAAEAAKPAEEAPAAATATIGQAAPDFTLNDEAGAAHTLAQHKGKIVVLEWTNPECPFVKRHYDKDTMAKSFETTGKDEVVWLAIDSTKSVTADATKEWKGKEGFTYSVLLDADGKVGKTYGAKTTPHMFVIDKEGKLAYSGAIDDDPTGKSESPRNYVLDAVQAIKDGKAPEVSTTDPYGCSVKYAS